jgi:hypothetical protein
MPESVLIGLAARRRSISATSSPAIATLRAVPFLEFSPRRRTKFSAISFHVKDAASPFLHAVKFLTAEKSLPLVSRFAQVAEMWRTTEFTSFNRFAESLGHESDNAVDCSRRRTFAQPLVDISVDSLARQPRSLDVGESCFGQFEIAFVLRRSGFKASSILSVPNARLKP